MRTTDSIQTPRVSSEPENASARAWPLVAIVPLVILLLGYYLGPVQPHTDDLEWLAATEQGLRGAFKPHPFDHYRPTFYLWLSLLGSVVGLTPAVLGVAGVVLQVASMWLVFRLARIWLPVWGAALTAGLFAVHPVRQAHWFWASAQMDALCIAFAVLALILAAKTLESGPKTGDLVGLAVATLMAAFSKETALALPLAVLLLPIASDRSRRVWVVLCAGAAVAVALVASAWVLDGGGRGAALLASPNLSSLPWYGVRLVLPIDLIDFWYRAKSAASLGILWKALGVGISYVATALVALLLWRWRRKPWAQLAALFLVWGGAAWVLHQGPGADRSIGLGSVGVAMLVGGFAARRPARVGTLVIVLFCAIWAPLWGQSYRDWEAVDRSTVALASAVKDWREELGPDLPVVVLGLPFTVGSGGEFLRIEELDPKATASLVLMHADPAQPFATFHATGSTVSVGVDPPSSFGGCGAAMAVPEGAILPEAVMSDRACDPTGSLSSFTLHAEALQAESLRFEVLLWTGSKGARLSSLLDH